MIVLDSTCLIAFVIFILQALLTDQISLINVAHVVKTNPVIIGIEDE